MLISNQSVDQAGFRAGFGCDDQMFTVMLATEKAVEWNTYLWIAAVDFKKAFDCVEHWAIWDALRQFGVPGKYVDALAALYMPDQAVCLAASCSGVSNISVFFMAVTVSTRHRQHTCRGLYY